MFDFDPVKLFREYEGENRSLFNVAVMDQNKFRGMVQQNILRQVFGKLYFGFESSGLGYPCIRAGDNDLQQEASGVMTYFLNGHSNKLNFQVSHLMLEDPTKLVLDMQGRQFITDETFDPKRLINSDKFGVAPSNTTLTITYRTNDTDNVNASVGSINSIDSLLVEFVDERSLNTTYVDEVRSSFVVENEEPVIGSVTLPNSDELKRRIVDTFATQNRAVTEKDYEASCYSMPSKFGAIKRVKVVKDSDSFKRNLNLYILSEDEDGHLTNPSVNIKKNLKTWLDKNKMISDTIDIIDAKIVNLSIEFTALGVKGKSKTDVLDDSMKALTQYFSRIPEIGEPFMLNEVLSVLKKVDSVLDVKDVKVKRKTGTGYATTGLNVDLSLTSIKGNRTVEMPLNVIWEIKYPESDIRGIIL
jgi:phage-related baseplate assembly protein